MVCFGFRFISSHHFLGKYFRSVLKMHRLYSLPISIRFDDYCHIIFGII